MKRRYKELRSEQKKDLDSKTAMYSIYRKFSTPFTYAFVKLGISPSTISVMNFFPNLIGYFFLSLGTYAFIILGLLFFILFQILDMSDGEVARIQNPKAMTKYRKWEGVYFDTAGHFIEPICLGAGLGVGLAHLYNNGIYVTWGIILAIIFTLEYALPELVKSYFRRGIIERGIGLKEGLKSLQNRLIKRINKGRSWSDQNIFLKVFGVYPFGGLIFSREFFVPILIVLAGIEYLISPYTNLPLVLYGQAVGILSIYLFVVGIIKLIKIAGFILSLKKNTPISDFLKEL
ncbi:hypothetical protein KY347_02370 [Candidatus Woesearchaeota archaeon]|nr:hypothetical protein [Candidatus Woesearchaeota archaeon]